MVARSLPLLVGRDHRYEARVEQLETELADQEAKHAAYVTILTDQARAGLMAAVERARQLEAELNDLRASQAH